MKRLLLVEDDYAFEAILSEIASEECPGIYVDSLVTELEFMRWIEDETAALPDLIVLDIKIPLTLPSPDMPDLETPDPNGGLRCLQRLRESARHRNVPAYLISSTPLDIDNCLSKSKTGRDRLRKIIREVFC